MIYRLITRRIIRLIYAVEKLHFIDRINYPTMNTCRQYAYTGSIRTNILYQFSSNDIIVVT